MVTQTSLYESVTSIAEDYFGPAAPRFVARIITNHLGKAPQRIRAKDIPELVIWTKLTVSLLTDDTQEIEEFIDRIKMLGKK